MLIFVTAPGVGIDLSVLKWLNHHLFPGSAVFLSALSHLTTYISVAVAVTILIFSFVRKSRALRIKALIIGAVLISVLFFSQGLKALIVRERPFTTYQFIDKLSDGGGSSFPSGHTMEAFALAMALSILFCHKPVIVTAFTLAALIAYSRMALGVHYPSDVAGGLVVGLIIGFSVPMLLQKFINNEESMKRKK